MLELAEVVLRLTRSKSRIRFEPLPPDDPKQRKPDIAIAHSELAWEPGVALEEGLAKTIAYFRSILRLS